MCSQFGARRRKKKRGVFLAHPDSEIYYTTVSHSHFLLATDSVRIPISLLYQFPCSQINFIVTQFRWARVRYARFDPISLRLSLAMGAEAVHVTPSLKIIRRHHNGDRLSITPFRALPRPVRRKKSSYNGPRNWSDTGVSVPGAFKLDHLQPFKPILFWKISNFFTFILGSQFLLPQRANNGKREILATSNLDETEGFQCLGHSNWTTCSPLSPFCSEMFPTFSLSYWGANSYPPKQVSWIFFTVKYEKWRFEQKSVFWDYHPK